MATRSGGSGVGGGRAGGGGGGSGGGRRAPGGDDEEERRRIRSVAAKKRASRRWTNWGRTPPPSLAPYAVGARTAPARAREPALRLSPPPATWDVGEASSSASVHFQFYGLDLRVLIAVSANEPANREYRSLYSRYTGRLSTDSVSHALTL
jgi:hypothetical protein